MSAPRTSNRQTRYAYNINTTTKSNTTTIRPAQNDLFAATPHMLTTVAKVSTERISALSPPDTKKSFLSAIKVIKSCLDIMIVDLEKRIIENQNLLDPKPSPTHDRLPNPVVQQMMRSNTNMTRKMTEYVGFLKRISGRLQNEAIAAVAVTDVIGNDGYCGNNGNNNNNSSSSKNKQEIDLMLDQFMEERAIFERLFTEYRQKMLC